ncbi:MAG: RlmE family RNA methyltransferase [Candidatus Adiutrix intracellularis]|jgi:23S rRNA (uridine2552-2'-O)-methyltransferase|nr:RlmE family RNA methyltransferase [Candidatus Adiutrix intracellularis]
MVIKDRRRVDDYYSRKARQEGYPARSVYKIDEINQKYHLFRWGQIVLDLGCAPGSWSRYAAEQVGGAGRVIGLDLNPVTQEKVWPPQVSLYQADLLEGIPEAVIRAGPFDLILSDLAPRTTGRREVDQARNLELCHQAWNLAEGLLKPGGHFLFKIFQSQEGNVFILALASSFTKIIRLKPKASRSTSSELFILARFFKNNSVISKG